MNGARVLLAIAVLACMVGLLRFGSEGWGPLFAWLWTEGGYDEAGALAALRNAGWCGVGLALLAPFRPLGLLGLPLAAWLAAAPVGFRAHLGWLLSRGRTSTVRAALGFGRAR